MPTTIKNRLTKWSNLVHNLSCPYRQKDPTKHNNLRQNGNNGATKHGEVRTAMADPRNQRSWKAEISTDQNPNPVAFNTLHEFLCDSPGVAHVDRVAMPRILDFLQLYVEMITWQVPFWDHSTALCQNPTANPLFGGYECLWYSPNGSKCFMSVFFLPPKCWSFTARGPCASTEQSQGTMSRMRRVFFTRWWYFTPGSSNPSDVTDLAMGQYLLIPFLGGWTSIYQLFWCSPGVQGFDTLPFDKSWNASSSDVFGQMEKKVTIKKFWRQPKKWQ